MMCILLPLYSGLDRRILKGSTESKTAMGAPIAVCYYRNRYDVIRSAGAPVQGARHRGRNHRAGENCVVTEVNHVTYCSGKTRASPVGSFGRVHIAGARR